MDALMLGIMSVPTSFFNASNKVTRPRAVSTNGLRLSLHQTPIPTRVSKVNIVVCIVRTPRVPRSSCVIRVYQTNRSKLSNDTPPKERTCNTGNMFAPAHHDRSQYIAIDQAVHSFEAKQSQQKHLALSRQGIHGIDIDQSGRITRIRTRQHWPKCHGGQCK